MSAVQNNIDNAKTAQKMGEFQNIGNQILNAVLASSEAVQSIDQQMSDSGIDAEDLKEFIERASEQLAQQEAHKRLKLGRDKDQRKLLGSAIKIAEGKVKEAEESGPLLEDGRKKAGKPSAKEGFANNKKAEAKKIVKIENEADKKAEDRAAKIAAMKERHKGPKK